MPRVRAVTILRVDRSGRIIHRMRSNVPFPIVFQQMYTCIQAVADIVLSISRRITLSGNHKDIPDAYMVYTVSAH